MTLGLVVAISTTAWAGNGYEAVTGSFGEACKSTPCPGGEFDEPTSVAVNDENEDVYVLDSGDDRIEWFSADGSEFEGQFNGSGEYEVAGKKETAAGPTTGKFLNPGEIAVNNDLLSPAHGDVYVADVGHEVIDQFNASGKYETQIMGGRCENETETPPCAGGKLVPFSGLLEVAVDPTGNLWVYEAEHADVYEFNETGNFITTFPTHNKTVAPGFAVDSQGNVYVTSWEPGERFSSVIEDENATGNELREIAHESVPSVSVPSVSLALIASTNDVLIDNLTTIELFRPPFGEPPFRTFPTTGLSESDGIAVNGAEGEGILYATQRVGDDVEFFSPGAPGKPEVLSATAVSTSFEGGQFEAVINPNNRATTYSVEYSSEVSANGEVLEGAITTIPGETTLLAEFGHATVTLTGAQFPETRGSYYYRVVATNELGTATSKVEPYTKLPTVSEEAILERTSTSATLEASVNPDYFRTHYRFEYGESQGELERGEGVVIHGRNVRSASPLEVCPESQVEGGTGILVEELNQRCPVAAEVTGLTPGHVYYYRVVAENGVSKELGNANKGAPVTGTSEPLEPYAAPAVTTGEPDAITSTTATLLGEVNPEGAAVTYYFAYVSDAGYQEGSADPYASGETTIPRELPAGEVPEAVGPVQASDLLPSTTYHYALVAINRFGAEAVGTDRVFVTAPASPPGAVTGAASAVTPTSATLSGVITTNGLETSYGFEFGTVPGSYGPITGRGTAGGVTTETVSVTLSELAPQTTYYYRITATSIDGTVPGAPGSFTTPALPSTGLPVIPVSPPLLAQIPASAFETGIGETPKKTQPLTIAQKLHKALEACKKDKSKAKRSQCEKAAKKRYKVSPHKRSAKK
jgi:hypothetical protein